jgi:hypothetical protein
MYTESEDDKEYEHWILTKQYVTLWIRNRLAPADSNEWIF